MPAGPAERARAASPGGGAGTGAALHTERRVVAFQDVDAAGIVFFARVFDYFHDAYVGFLRARGAPLEAALQDGSWVAPLRHASADFRRPLRFGDQIAVSVARVVTEATEYRVHFRIDAGGGLACEGETVHVSVDPATFTRSPLPELLRRALESPPG
jgi:1,4-dihydroxy-2-naphthoyl-CoA hydrolase